MDRFFCMLALCALLFFAAGRMALEPSQPVFFSLLFPQLMPGFEETATPNEALDWGADFL